MPTPRPAVSPSLVGLILLCTILFVTVPFAPTIGFALHLWWNTENDPVTPPNNHAVPHAIHTYDTKAPTADAQRPTHDVLIDFDDTGELFPTDPPPAKPTAGVFDDGSIDHLTNRKVAFDDWIRRNKDLWNLADPELQHCVETKYVNAFGSSPEAGLDECLAEDAHLKAEEQARTTPKPRESMEGYLDRTGASMHLGDAVVDCAFDQYRQNPDFSPDDAIGFCLE